MKIILKKKKILNNNNMRCFSINLIKSHLKKKFYRVQIKNFKINIKLAHVQLVR